MADGFSKIFAVAAGGAVGAVVRHLVNISPISTRFENFPLHTFLVNISGSFLAGLLLTLFADKLEVSDTVRAAVIVGFLGAFTTFSTFEIEIYELAKNGNYASAGLYLVLSIVAGLVGIIAGVKLAQWVG